MSTYEPSFFAVLVSSGKPLPEVIGASSMTEATQNQKDCIKAGYLGALLVAGKASYITMRTVAELNSFNPEIGSYIQ